jgi:hypothetical protein
MTREQKIIKRKERARRRADKHNQEWVNIVTRASWDGVPPAAIRNPGHSWPDSNSPTGYSQKCSYYGICQSPCNGDC